MTSRLGGTVKTFKRQKNGGQKNAYPALSQTPRHAVRGSLLQAEHCSDDTKLYFSVSHFSVFAFVQANSTLSN